MQELRLRRRKATWQPQSFTAVILHGSIDEFTFSPAKLPPRRRRPRPPPPAPGGAAGDGDGAPAPLAAPEGGDGDPGDEMNLDADMEDMLDRMGFGVEFHEGDAAADEEAEVELGAAEAEEPEERLLDEHVIADADDDGGGSDCDEAPDGGCGNDGLFVDGYAATNMVNVRIASLQSRREFDLAFKTANVQGLTRTPSSTGPFRSSSPRTGRSLCDGMQFLEKGARSIWTTLSASRRLSSLWRQC